MKHLLCIVVFAWVAASGFCGTDAWWVFHENEFTNAANFHEIGSATLPAEVISAGAAECSWTIEREGRGHLTPAKSWRFIWAVSDEKHYVLHTEYVAATYTATNYWIVIAVVPETNGAPRKVHRVPCHSFKNFRTFARELQADVQGPRVGF
jgi:hypothetical protein